jgi:hypothetical protein
MLKIAMALWVASHAAQTSPQWSTVDLLGWSADGTTSAWRAAINSDEESGDEPAGRLVFLLLTDTEGRPVRVFRDHRQVAHGEDFTVSEEASEYWRNAAAEEAGAAWQDQQSMAAQPRSTPADQAVRDMRGVELFKLATKSSGKGCQTITLVATTAGFDRPLAVDRCARGERQHASSNNTVRVGWAPGGSFVAISWNVQRYTAGTPADAGIVERGHAVVVPRKTFAAVDLLDSGAKAGLQTIKRTVESSGFPVAHMGKASAPRKSTEIFYASGFEAEAKELAAALGVAPDAVKPRDWKSPYAITVAAGSGAKPRRRRSALVPLRHRTRPPLRILQPKPQ